MLILNFVEDNLTYIIDHIGHIIRILSFMISKMKGNKLKKTPQYNK